MACLPSFWVLCPNSYNLVVMLYYLLLDVCANECVSRGAGDHITLKSFHESPVNPEVNRRSFFFSFSLVIACWRNIPIALDAL